jgi:hypothetical protein
MRWIRFVAAVVIGFSIPLTVPGVASADAAQSLVDSAQQDAAARGTTAGIAVLDRVTGVYTDNGPNARLRFGSASLVKLFIADSVLRRASLGQVALSPADRDRIGLMLRSSDDAAASDLWSRFGASGIVTDVVARYGLPDTAPPANPRYWGLTQVSAHDLVRFYDGLLSGRGGLRPADRDLIVGQLRANTARGTDGVYQWFGLHDALPREPVLGIKQGWMCCFSDGFIWRHSTGLVGPDARYVVVVLTRDPGSRGAAHTVESATRIVQHLFPAGLVPRVQGLIAERWYSMGAWNSQLGLPVRNEIPLVGGGAMSAFERGSIYWSPGTGARWVVGDILRAYGTQQYERGFLGYPTSDEIRLAGGALSRFQGGYVYWSPGTGARYVTGDILRAYGTQQYERGFLGYPTSDQLRLTGGGTLNRFQGGYIYSSPGNGAHYVTGDILRAYGAQGWERGPLGYPTSDPHAVPGGTRVDFQQGSLTLTPSGEVLRDAPATAAASTTVPTPAPAPTPTPAPTPAPTPVPGQDPVPATGFEAAPTPAGTP